MCIEMTIAITVLNSNTSFSLIIIWIRIVNSMYNPSSQVKLQKDITVFPKYFWLMTIALTEDINQDATCIYTVHKTFSFRKHLSKVNIVNIKYLWIWVIKNIYFDWIIKINIFNSPNSQIFYVDNMTNHNRRRPLLQTNDLSKRMVPLYAKMMPLYANSLCPKVSRLRVFVPMLTCSPVDLIHIK